MPQTEDDGYVEGAPISSRTVRARVTEIRKGVPLVNMNDFEPAPRAVVAISPDRQWLVVLLPEVHKWRRMWAVLRCTYTGDYKLQETIEDTGQSAGAVLDAFLKRRGS